jgi:hypothetical protein
MSKACTCPQKSRYIHSRIIHAYMHTCMHACMHNYVEILENERRMMVRIHTYVHTYIHTYVSTDGLASWLKSAQVCLCIYAYMHYLNAHKYINNICVYIHMRVHM